jgi:diketogulonate reductase-like aldo/keto reductase
MAKRGVMIDNACMGIRIDRRQFIGGLAGMTAWVAMPRLARPASEASGHSRVVPGTGEALPAIGLGTAYTFDVPEAGGLLEARAAIMRAFFELGGRMIDSAPMYGRAENIIGKGLQSIGGEAPVFSATKVWIPGAGPGRLQMERSQSLWGVERFDLIYVHNLVDWQSHLPWLREWKAEGRVRYIGVTTSHGRRHDELEQVLRTEEMDFVQFTYNVEKRVAEQRLLPLARDRGLAVVVNRPFERGGLFRRVRGQPLPDWAPDIECASWAQFFLKFIISHPDVTCAIPATTNIDHLRENMGALHGRLPDTAQRREMAAYFERVSA